jgi:hypothetical protein
VGASKSCVIALLLPASLFSQGFDHMLGVRKAKDATLKRLLPAQVNLNQKRISVEAQLMSSSKAPADLKDILKTKLVTSIQKDNRYVVDEKNPETVLHFTVTNYYVEARKTQAAQNQPVCTFFTGKIEVSYQAIDFASKTPFDSENLTHTITADDPKKPGGITSVLHRGPGGCGTHAKATENEARDELVDAIVQQMSQRAAPFEETITVPVPGGKLEPLSALAMSGRWSTLLEDAEKMEKLPKQEDDAYRSYLIGLANEALAYQDAREASELEKNRRGDTTSDRAKQAITQEDKDFEEAQNYLDKATKAYKDAIQAKSGEKEFRTPDGRMEEAVKLYATIARHKVEYQEAVAKRQHGAVTTVASRGAEAPAAKSSLDQIVAMCQDHIPDIGEMIRDHPTELAFEKGLTLAEELRLKKECGTTSASILNQIKAQVAARAKK